MWRVCQSPCTVHILFTFPGESRLRDRSRLPRPHRQPQRGLPQERVYDGRLKAESFEETTLSA